MPYMQRITWSGIALHAGDLPGYPASHGCIRLTNDFAIRLWHLTKRGTRVIIAHEDVRPVEITNPQLFVPKPRVASTSPESGTATLASNDSVTAATTHAPLMSKTDEGTKTSDPASAGVRAQKVVPISVFVSRQLSKLFVRRGFTPLFDVPIKIRDLAEPMGTHVFSAMEFQNEGAADSVDRRVDPREVFYQSRDFAKVAQRIVHAGQSKCRPGAHRNTARRG